MKCKRHTVDFSSNIGVCASCLRERLHSLAASAAAAAADDRHSNSRKSDPPLLIFPRSVSPYVTCRKSDVGDSLAYNRRFFTTPQVGPPCRSSAKDFVSNRSFKTKPIGFSRFSNLFKSRSEDFDSNPKSDFRFSSRNSCDASESSSWSRSWISSIISAGRSKKQPTTACYIEDIIAGGRPRRVFCRGMSPARDTEPEPEPESISDPTPESIDESPGRSKSTPATSTSTKTPGRRKITTGIGKSISGMAICLSPLVRASPHCRFNRRSKFPAEFGNAGELPAPEKPHISAAASFCANRSKKLVDLGRVNRRR